MGVSCLICAILSYFASSLGALMPCHGKAPFRKYNRTQPKDSRSSRRDCSDIYTNSHQFPHFFPLFPFGCLYIPLPRWVRRLMQRAVPDRLFRSQSAMCFPVFGSRYDLAIPKSIMNISPVLPDPARPIKKLSGLTSLQINPSSCIACNNRICLKWVSDRIYIYMYTPFSVFYHLFRNYSNSLCRKLLVTQFEKLL